MINFLREDGLEAKAEIWLYPSNCCGLDVSNTGNITTNEFLGMGIFSTDTVDPGDDKIKVHKVKTKIGELTIWTQHEK